MKKQFAVLSVALLLSVNAVSMAQLAQRVAQGATTAPTAEQRRYGGMEYQDSTAHYMVDSEVLTSMAQAKLRNQGFRILTLKNNPMTGYIEQYGRRIANFILSNKPADGTNVTFGKLGPYYIILSNDDFMKVREAGMRSMFGKMRQRWSERMGQRGQGTGPFAGLREKAAQWMQKQGWTKGGAAEQTATASTTGQESTTGAE